MPLYKYVTPERTDILKNGLIRFTQPVAFNDPFETLPCFLGGLPDDIVKGLLEDNLADPNLYKGTLLSIFKTEMNKRHPETIVPAEAWDVINNLIPAKDAAKIMQPIASIVSNQFAQFMGEGDLFKKYTLKSVLKSINKDYGLLCLAENPNNLLMWAHYAASHTGFAIEFNEKHPFFDKREKQEELGRCLTKVTYTKVRPKTFLLDPKIEEEQFRKRWAHDIFFTKSEHWEYEEEWRMLEFLKNCSHIERNEPYDICLFPIPFDCITGVIFGCRALDNLKSDIGHLKQTNSSYSHIQLFEAYIDEKEYMLNFRAII
ncbi:MAG: DUF2971 domain-containing protein [Desulfomonilia bacterium]|jgi:hypothetical protein